MQKPPSGGFFYGIPPHFSTPAYKILSFFLDTPLFLRVYLQKSILFHLNPLKK